MSDAASEESERIRLLERQVEILSTHLRNAGNVIDGLQQEVRDLEDLNRRTLRARLGRTLRRILGLSAHQRREFTPAPIMDFPPQVD